jgi:AAA+ ATPase superfamily predicted ATPase
MTEFQYGTLLKAENICNLTRERIFLEKAILAHEKVVIYGRRNSGKTSLVKNAIIPWFEKTNKKSFVLFVDLMEVKDVASIHERIRVGFERAFSKYFPAKSLLKAAMEIVGSLRPIVNLDELTGAPQLSLEISKQRAISFVDIFFIIAKKISPTHEVLIVLDEFQDVALVSEAQGLFRQVFQEFEAGALIIMGSKQHMLADLFARPKAPLARFGKDLNFGFLPYEEYHRYIEERLHPRKLTIDFKVCKELQDLLFRDPEAINIVCQNLQALGTVKKISSGMVRLQIDLTIEARSSRFEQYLSQFSSREQELLVALSKYGPIQMPSGKDFLQHVHVTARSVQVSFKKFLDHSVIEKRESGYQILDPLFYYFLKKYR